MLTHPRRNAAPSATREPQAMPTRRQTSNAVTRHLGLLCLTIILFTIVSPPRSLSEEGIAPVDAKKRQAVPPLLAKRGKLIVDDDGSRPRGKKATVTFASKAELHAWAGAWERSPDSKSWRSTWEKGMHTPVARYHGFNQKNLIVEVTFRCGQLSEPWHTQSFRIALDDRPRITGHVLSAWANPNNEFIETGFLLQHIQKTPEKTILKDLLLDHQPIHIAPNTWYTAILEVVDDEALFRMGSHVAWAKADEMRSPKNQVTLTLGKTWHEVKRVRIWEATLDPEWPNRKSAAINSRNNFAPVPHSYRQSK